MIAINSMSLLMALTGRHNRFGDQYVLCSTKYKEINDFLTNDINIGAFRWHMFYAVFCVTSEIIIVVGYFCSDASEHQLTLNFGHLKKYPRRLTAV